jgi:hypothetical protein
MIHEQIFQHSKNGMSFGGAPAGRAWDGFASGIKESYETLIVAI